MLKEILVKAPYDHYKDNSQETLNCLKRWLDAVIFNFCEKRYSLEIVDDCLYLILSDNTESVPFVNDGKLAWLNDPKVISNWNRDKNYLLGHVCKAFCNFAIEMRYSDEDKNHLVFQTDMYFDNRMLNFRM